MKKKMPKLNMRSKGAPKGVLVAVAAAAAVAVLVLAYLFLKDPINYRLAQSKASSGDFAAAQSYAEKCSDEESKVLLEYIVLRREIINNYALLLNEYDAELIADWQQRAVRISEGLNCKKTEINETAKKLCDTLTYILQGAEAYERLRPDISELMDVFLEINRLYTKQPDGKNTAFTVEEEENRLTRWYSLVVELSDYTETVRNSQKIYLLNYLLKESQGEIDDIIEAMNKVVASGYSKTERVRFGGTAQKQYPDMHSSDGKTINFMRKTDYEAAMRDSVMRAYIECLSEFYAF